MKDRKTNMRIAKPIMDISENWDIPLKKTSSLWPSVGGVVYGKVPVVCGIGPTARDLYTPQESVNRTSLIQRTLLLAEFLVKTL
ncbi:hypothetical protein EPICR_20275 [Candidatus Desulfarcum epimagneticum]|uniref:Uncharacterized protein n=1 Tax=uncultured Desulfobacteraceae bacterium TaxID=218296 RepID=A0A484HGJ8_9BACT|nr:hypothetical protein EPICR_20275 [uncultured Desulfobacteraceae bacterium]